MPSWTKHSLDDLEDLYWSEIAPDLRRDGLDPHEPHATEVTQNYRGLDYALREHHGYTVKEFLVDVVGLEESDTQGESTADQLPEPVQDSIASYLDSIPGLGNDYTENTLRSIKYRLAAYADAYCTVNETPLLDQLSDVSAKPDEIDRVTLAMQKIDAEYDSNEGKIRVLGEAVRYYDWMDETGRIEYNPAAVVERRSGWDREDRDNPALEPNQIQSLYDTADGLEERFLVVALCAWGLRTSEVAAFHVSQCRLDPEERAVPYLEFAPGERKNNSDTRSTVSLLYGTDVLSQRISELSDRDDWNGYLFPSTAAETGHISPNTVTNRFKRLAERAGVDVDGGVAKPKMGRRFWYETYADAIKAVLERLESAAEEQGSVSPSVIQRDYLDEDARRRQRRNEMRTRLQEVFGDIEAV
jgi:integrase